MKGRSLLLAFVLLVCTDAGVRDARLKSAFRRPSENGWNYVHLEGTPTEIGFQHGYLLAAEIDDAHKVVAFGLRHDTGRPWGFFREAAKTVFWPRVNEEYRAELRGIVEGLNAQHVKLDLWDVVAMNAWLEFSPYYVTWWDTNHGTQTPTAPAVSDHCSAFVATGSYTKDGRVIIGHITWMRYMEGSRWNLIFDICPVNGHRILMDGFPGLIHSGDDFGINSAGVLITETTITRFNGFDPKGVPEFVRARKAMQYASSIDDFARIMREGNNGAYANNWLVADRKTNEIASLELGLKNTNLWRKKDGYFSGANFPVDPRLLKEETAFPGNDPSLSACARRIRWDQLMAEHKGKIDINAGKMFLSDHFDTYTGKVDPDERTLCGHIDLSPRGLTPWQPAYGPAGAVQAKVVDAAMAEEMSFAGAFGHPCGMDFNAAEHLRKHPEFAWQTACLRDLKPYPWTVFRAFAADEWKPLFDGKGLNGWAKILRPSGATGFLVENGVLRTVGDAKGMLWYTREKIGNATLRVVYKMSNDKGNSGVFIRIPVEPESEDDARNKGIEVQIDNQDDEWHCTGTLYSLTKALARPYRPAGEWNRMDITVDGLRTVVYLNGARVTDYDGKAPVPARKYAWEPVRGPRPESGYIGIQNHDANAIIYFKEICVKPLK